MIEELRMKSSCNKKQEAQYGWYEISGKWNSDERI